jgi:hypothetical protein
VVGSLFDISCKFWCNRWVINDTYFYVDFPPVAGGPTIRALFVDANPFIEKCAPFAPLLFATSLDINRLRYALVATAISFKKLKSWTVALKNWKCIMKGMAAKAGQS